MMPNARTKNARFTGFEGDRVSSTHAPLPRMPRDPLGSPVTQLIVERPLMRRGLWSGAELPALSDGSRAVPALTRHSSELRLDMRLRATP